MGNHLNTTKRIESNEKYDLNANMIIDHKIGRDVYKYYRTVHPLGEGSMGAVTCVRKVRTPQTLPKKKNPISNFCLHKAKSDCIGGNYSDDSSRISTDNAEYAMKTIQLSRLSDEFIEEFRNEIDILKTLDHPNIVKAYDVFERKRQIFMIMEYCSGGDLYQRVPYTESQAAKVIKCLLSAIAYMHSKGVAHRDLKFENVMFESEKPNAEIKLIDFGLSKKFGRNETMSEGVGTIYSMAPEVFQRKYTNKVDIWSIGVLSYMLLYNKRPFKNQKNRKEQIKIIMKGEYKFPKSDCSPEAKKFIKTLIVVDPEQRSTAESALENKWFRQQGGNIDPKPQESVVRDVGESLSLYRGQSAFKKMVNMVIAHKLSFDEIYDLRTVFEKYDSSFDGQISLIEFTEATCERSGCSREDAEELFNGIDVNRDGYVNYTEFIAAALEARGHIEVEKVAEAFDRLDRGNTGYITEKDLRKILGTDYTHEKIQEFMKEVDVDKDGRISYNEFLLLFKSEKTREFRQKSKRLLKIDDED
eukprot:CAMPEP_0172488470 /NCGR_PEP_ID=MMETSP1066-20121228/17993_1 /TAXON_ID=671091 /ORGANISM="Coscinodiscus wailesii, Strain CCMP2513" /LENGTH=527 /DNA_ID=CAMNT_0013255701 /DNA_START=77 /DNA_END=1660 /DNA_ORIENTATION=-